MRSRDESGMQGATPEFRILQNLAEKRDIGFHARNRVLSQRPV